LNILKLRNFVVKKFIITICLLFVVQSCGPFLGTIGVVSLGAHSKQKGLGTTINDNIIKTKISNFIFKFDENLIPDTKIFVNNGSVLFTGKVKVPENKIEITKLAWSVKGVKEVNNELQVIDKSSIKNIARDLASLGEIRARLISDKSINSLNFSIDVVNDKVYLSGVAKDKSEMLRVKDHAVSARFVKEVYNYIILDSDVR
jgi:osmotically-inducible protein OsmY